MDKLIGILSLSAIDNSNSLLQIYALKSYFKERIRYNEDAIIFGYDQSHNGELLFRLMYYRKSSGDNDSCFPQPAFMD